MMAREALRYLLAGGFNTAFSYGVYLLLLRWLHYRLSYVLAFVAGVGLSFLLLRHLVFARPGKRFSLAWVGLIHGLQLALSLAVVELWVQWLHGPAALAPLVALALVVPLSFALQRWVFTPHATA